jgi:hypothetical protein
LLGKDLEARRDQLRATLPIGRVVGPADVAALAVQAKQPPPMWRAARAKGDADARSCSAPPEAAEATGQIGKFLRARVR